METLATATPYPPKIILYGGVGSGKTAFVQTLGGDVVFLDFDGNMDCGLHIKDQYSEDRPQVKLIRFHEDKEKPKAYDNFLTQIENWKRATDRGETLPIKAICVDSLTALCEVAFRKALYTEGRLGKGPEIQDWNKLCIYVTEALLLLKTLPYVIILIAHDDVEKDGDANVIKLSALGQKLPIRIPRFFNEVWYLQSMDRPGGVTERVLRTEDDSKLKVARSCRCIKNYTVINKTTYKSNEVRSESVSLKEILKQYGYEL